ncbi:MAG: ribosomal protein S12 methylthiotransferase RimO [Lentisphaerae bacterium GWF2_52_8]|nr:MAG: ribosomal protein S12 methylthiotransferase RimO [Lentisphaerae bacterium GWF2_52_8]
MPKMLPSVYIVSLGCPKNLVDTELIAGGIISGGLGLSLSPENASVWLINTCAFIPSARSEAEENLLEALEWKKKNPKRKVVLCGCFVQWDASREARSKFPGVDLWLGIDDVPKAAGLISSLFKKTMTPLGSDSQAPPKYLYNHLEPRLQLTLPHYAYIKIADGCKNCCAYCSIPRIRGSLRSRNILSVLAEARNLLDGGAKELILIAQDSSSFGEDRRGRSEIMELLRAFESLAGNYWLRLMYLHPASFPDELVSFIANAKHLIPYIEMPLQHIADPILSSMGRKTDGKRIRDILSSLRKSVPNLAIRTTFMTGFPGESKAHFQELCEFVSEQEFERLGVFSFCPEAGTPAAQLPRQVVLELREERRAQLMELQAKISLKKNKSLVGRSFDVIVDSVEKGAAWGRTYMDAPEIDNLVKILAPPSRRASVRAGSFVRVKIDEADVYDLIATPFDE